MAYGAFPVSSSAGWLGPYSWLRRNGQGFQVMATWPDPARQPSPSEWAVGAEFKLTAYAESMHEDQLLREVIALASEHDVLAYHVYDSRKTTGNGFPDLVLAGQRNLLFAELKSDYGSLTSEQHEWRYRILASGGFHSVWRPKDLGHVEAVVKNL